MLQHVHILTLTHRFAKLKAVGELVAAFEADGDLRDRLERLRADGRMNEICYASTCNRLLLLFTSDEEVNADFRRQLLGPEHAERTEAMRHLQGMDAINHLYEVAASIDSLVVGERQILGQLRERYEQCRQWGLIGDDLRIIFNQAVLAAKDVYANTRIGEKSVSVVSLAMQQLRRFAPSRQSRILMVGAGQTNVLVTKFLRKEEYRQLTVANRTRARAESLVSGFERGAALSLDELDGYTGGFDVLFVCTAAARATISAERFGRLLAGEDSRDKIVVDLGLPADVAEEARAAYDFHYIGIEELKKLAGENLDFRRREVERAHEVLSAHKEEVVKLYQQRLLERAMAGLPAEIKAIRHRAVNQVFAKELEGLDPTTRELMDRMMIYMEKGCIGIPMKAAREAILG